MKEGMAERLKERRII